jgi:hypothetical protein
MRVEEEQRAVMSWIRRVCEAEGGLSIEVSLSAVIRSFFSNDCQVNLSSEYVHKSYIFQLRVIKQHAQ